MALISTLVALVTAQATPVVVDAQLLVHSKVPSPAGIKPYRSALVAGEYLVKKVVKGRDAELKPGAKIRVFRWGILDAKATGLGKVKKGSTVRLSLSRLAGWTQMEREYQVDDLESDLAITYYVDAAKIK